VLLHSQEGELVRGSGDRDVCVFPADIPTTKSFAQRVCDLFDVIWSGGRAAGAKREFIDEAILETVA
jgi:hypothetical protein